VPRRDDAFQELDLLLKFPGPGVALAGLAKYLAATEEQLSHLKAQYQVRLKARLKKHGHLMHPDDVEDEEYDAIRTTEELFPRVFRGAYLVALWAVFESAITDIADYAKSQLHQTFSLDELRSGDFLSQAEKYFERVLDLKVFSDRTARKQMEVLKALRNALVHDNGQVRGLPKGIQRGILGDSHPDAGFTVCSDLHNSYIIPTPECLQDNLSLVRRCLEDLSDRAFKKLHKKPG